MSVRSRVSLQGSMKGLANLAVPLLVLIASAMVLPAAERCALTVKLIDQRSNPIRALKLVQLFDSSGQIVGAKTASDGAASFCEFGFGAHTITVGGDEECGRVEVSNLKYDPLLDQVIFVVVNHCMVANRISNGCLAYLRLVDSQGKPVLGGISVSGDEESRSFRSSLFIHSVALGRKLEIGFRVDGYKPNKVIIDCSGLQIIERDIVMVKQ